MARQRHVPFDLFALLASLLVRCDVKAARFLDTTACWCTSLCAFFQAVTRRSPWLPSRYALSYGRGSRCPSSHDHPRFGRLVIGLRMRIQECHLEYVNQKGLNGGVWQNAQCVKILDLVRRSREKSRRRAGRASQL